MQRDSTANRLRQIMREQNLRQIDILNLSLPFCSKYNVKMNKSDISQYVSGKVEPSQDKLVILGMALNVTEPWLMGFDVPKERQNINLSIEQYLIKTYGESILEAFNLYSKLDSGDQGEIRGEMKQMLKAEKYLKQRESKHA